MTFTTGDDIKEALQHVRTMSAVRFAAMPIFFAGTGALADAYHDDAAKYGDRLVLIPIAGLVLAAVFTIVETVLSYNIKRWYEELGEQQPSLIVLQHRSRGGFLKSIRFVLLAPFALALAYWSTQVVGCVGTWKRLGSLLVSAGPSTLVGCVAFFGAMGLALLLWRDPSPEQTAAERKRKEPERRKREQEAGSRASTEEPATPPKPKPDLPPSPETKAGQPAAGS